MCEISPPEATEAQERAPCAPQEGWGLISQPIRPPQTVGECRTEYLTYDAWFGCVCECERVCFCVLPLLAWLFSAATALLSARCAATKPNAASWERGREKKAACVFDGTRKCTRGRKSRAGAQKHLPRVDLLFRILIFLQILDVSRAVGFRGFPALLLLLLGHLAK